MTDTKPGADELRVRQLLIKQGVGPDAGLPSPVPPKPTVRPRDWLDDILDTAPQGNPQAKKPSEVAKKTPKPADEPAEDTSDEDDTDGELPRWDPIAIADKIAEAYQRRPAGERLRDAAHVVIRSKARLGQLFYTASGVWMAWRIGLTPWLLHETADAPTGIPVAVLFTGWGLNRRLDHAPLLVAWCGRAVYTATVINLVLHP